MKPKDGRNDMNNLKTTEARMLRMTSRHTLISKIGVSLSDRLLELKVSEKL